MTENELKKKTSYLWFVPEIIGIVFVLLACAAIHFFMNAALLACIEGGLFSAIAISVLGLAVRKFYPVPKDSLEEALKGLKAFWFLFLAGLILAVMSIFIPNPAWPFTALFVLLAVFSSPLLGLLGGSILLLVAVVLSGAGAGVFVLYFICGALAVCSFLPVKDDIKLGRPLVVTLLGLLACEMAGIILSSESQFVPEQFLLPGINILITGLLLFAGLRIYALNVQYSLRDRYQLLNDTEYPILAEAREDNKKIYKQSIHTAYFCERIARELNMNIDAVKCAGYYHRFCPQAEEDRNTFYSENNIPGPVQAILDEYINYLANKGKYHLITKEAAVLIASQTIVGAVLAMYEKDNQAQVSEQIDRLVDSAFLRFEKFDIYAECQITYKDIRIMKNVFKGDKLYYDFLR